MQNKRAHGISSAVCFFFLFMFFSTAVRAEDPSVYCNQLIDRAETQALYNERYWDILLHYMPSGSGKKSLIDDPKFFCAKDGKHNPRQELIETLKSFFQSEISDTEHPRCRFPARYHWLKERLSIEEERLPPARCKNFEEMLNKMSPYSATLIFPAEHPNNPASMFGHTLIRIDSEKDTSLLSYAITYAAYIENPEKDMFYAPKGILGFYRGYYSIMPYFEKTKEYSDIDHRDVWEYQLDLTKEEVARMSYHIWELKDIYADYYFFDENCSYNLLFLFEAARPSLKLTDKFFYWVMPVETIRVVREAGLVKDVYYRPSLMHKINAGFSLLSPSSRSMGSSVCKGGLAPDELLKQDIPAAEKAAILDSCAGFLQYKLSRHEIGEEEYKKQFFAMLKARSTITADSGYHNVPVPRRPEDGHGPAMLSLGTGVKDTDFFTELSWRPAYHDLMNSDHGYKEGNEVKFVEITGRWYPSKSKYVLQSLDVIDIRSFEPQSSFFKPLSWEIQTGIKRKSLAEENETNVLYARPGGGMTYRLFGGLVYLLAEVEGDYSSSLEKNYSVGLGGTVGTIHTIMPDTLKLNIAGRYLNYCAGNEHIEAGVEAALSYFFEKNKDLVIQLSRERSFNYYYTEGKLLVRLFF